MLFMNLKCFELDRSNNVSKRWKGGWKSAYLSQVNLPFSEVEFKVMAVQ